MAKNSGNEWFSRDFKSFPLLCMHVEGKHTCLLSCFVATHEQDRASFVIQEGGGRRRESFVKRLIMQTTSYSSCAKGAGYGKAKSGI